MVMSLRPLRNLSVHSLAHSFIHSSVRSLLSLIPGTVLGKKDTSVNKTHLLPSGPRPLGMQASQAVQNLSSGASAGDSEKETFSFCRLGVETMESGGLTTSPGGKQTEN